MRLARKKFGTLKKLLKKVDKLKFNIDNNINSEETKAEYNKLINFVLNYDSFKPFEELICCSYNGTYVTFDNYIQYIIKDYEKGYELARDLFDSKEEYITYALRNHFDDEDVDVLMLKPNFKIA